MFDFLKRKNSDEETIEQSSKNGLFSRLKQGLAKTRASLTNGIAALLLGKKELNAELLSEIEMLLLSADVGVETTELIIR